jgi:DNA-binding LacI/PurR family transcriptional regulator
MEDTTNAKRTARSIQPAIHKPVSLKQLAAHLGLNPATVSVVLNDVPGRSISQATRDRIKAAAKEMNYHPSLLARSLRNRRTLTIGILVPELGDGYHTEVMSGIGDQLINSGYFYFTAHHRHQKRLVEEYTRMLLGRGAQGIIAIDTALEHSIPIPVVAVAGHRHIEGVTNVILEHALAAELTLNHLYSLGHRQIAFMRGHPFTAIVAFNDISAFGAIRALQDCNLRVPQDVSVIGFDNIKAAAYTLPRLTTISQPLAEIGRIATQSLLNRIHGTAISGDEITVDPTLVIRESTGPVKAS